MSEEHEAHVGAAGGDHGESDQQHGSHDGPKLSPERTHRVWPWAVFLVVVVLVVCGLLVPMPYFVDSPGMVSATQPLVTISGHPSYRSDGRVMFTTVSERRATPFLLLQAWLDDTIDTVPVSVAVPSGNRNKERKFEQQQMDRSKLTALSLAFGRLGIPLTVTGSGALVQETMAGFPGAKVIRPGDTIVTLDGATVTTSADVAKAMAGRKVGELVSLELRRKGSAAPVPVQVELGKSKTDLSRGYLGVVLTTANEDVRLPFDIELDSGSVIGPSAGLAWTLGVLDRLTPGDLTHGRKVAVTGTIAPDGTVGPIGGIAQKIEGAKRAGATLFLYPASTSPAEVRRVREIAGDGIKIRPVGTLDDALKILDPAGLGAHRTESPSD